LLQYIKIDFEQSNDFFLILLEIIYFQKMHSVDFFFFTSNACHDECRLLIPSAPHISVADLDAPPPFDQNLRINASKIQDLTPKIYTFLGG
jgi:hypothetical protein